jgi:hypothetical protein
MGSYAIDQQDRCIFLAADQVEIKNLLGIPEKYTLITLVVLGYPGDPSVLSEEHRAAETGEHAALSLNKPS